MIPKRRVKKFWDLQAAKAMLVCPENARRISLTAKEVPGFPLAFCLERLGFKDTNTHRHKLQMALWRYHLEHSETSQAERPQTAQPA